MNKGFTLVELLAVLFILSVITIVAVPNVVNTNKNSKENELEQFKKTIENAAEVYVETHLENEDVKNLKQSANGAYCIPLSKLLPSSDTNQGAGLISQNLKDPDGNSITSLTSSVSVLATKVDGEIKYEYKESANCS